MARCCGFDEILEEERGCPPAGRVAPAARSSRPIKPIEEIFTEPACFGRGEKILLCSGDGNIRQSTWMKSLPPRRSSRRSCTTRRSLTCKASGMLSISSRSSVPLVSVLDLADTSLGGSRESTSLMAEHLAFKMDLVQLRN